MGPAVAGRCTQQLVGSIVEASSPVVTGRLLNRRAQASCASQLLDESRSHFFNAHHPPLPTKMQRKGLHTWGDHHLASPSLICLTNTHADRHSTCAPLPHTQIMKSDEDVRMISAEAPVLFARACEFFIQVSKRCRTAGPRARCTTEEGRAH